jgi:hypothetical protein
MGQSTPPADGGINIAGQNTTVTVHGDMIGDDQIINVQNITYNQYAFGNLPAELQKAFFASDIYIKSIPQAKFAGEKFDAYNNTWKSLQALRLTGDDLWEQATAERVLTFANQLRATKQLVYDGELYFQETDHQDLMRALKALAEFNLGKERVVDLVTQHDAEFVANELGEVIKRQIEQNRAAKAQYEAIRDQIRVSFKHQLSS